MTNLEKIKQDFEKFKQDLTIEQLTSMLTSMLVDAYCTELTGFKTSTYQLLDALTVALTESGAKSPVVALPLEEYMEKRGFKDKKEARKQVTDDLETLFNATISFKEKRKKVRKQDFHDIRILGSMGIRKGIITVSFGTAFYNILEWVYDYYAHKVHSCIEDCEYGIKKWLESEAE